MKLHFAEMYTVHFLTDQSGSVHLMHIFLYFTYRGHEYKGKKRPGSENYRAERSSVSEMHRQSSKSMFGGLEKKPLQAFLSFLFPVFFKKRNPNSRNITWLDTCTVYSHICFCYTDMSKQELCFTQMGFLSQSHLRFHRRLYLLKPSVNDDLRCCHGGLIRSGTRKNGVSCIIS